MRIASINLRINVMVDGKNAWPFRKNLVIEFIKKNDFDIIGCQEVSFDMLEDLKDGLSDRYHIIHFPRDNRGEGTPILYKKKLNPIEIHSYWLSETESIESMEKGSHFPRIVTYIKFDKLLFFNTHLDYASDEVCLKQAKHLIRIINQMNQNDDHVVITGDFNMHPSSKTIQFMLTHFLLDHQNQFSHQLTYHGFSRKTIGEPIDYIFYSKRLVTDHFTIHHHEGKKHISDHYPLSIDITT